MASYFLIELAGSARTGSIEMRKGLPAQYFLASSLIRANLTFLYAFSRSSFQNQNESRQTKKAPTSTIIWSYIIGLLALDSLRAWDNSIRGIIASRRTITSNIMACGLVQTEFIGKACLVSLSVVTASSSVLLPCMHLVLLDRLQLCLSNLRRVTV